LDGVWNRSVNRHVNNVVHGIWNWAVHGVRNRPINWHRHVLPHWVGHRPVHRHWHGVLHFIWHGHVALDGVGDGPVHRDAHATLDGDCHGPVDGDGVGGVYRDGRLVVHVVRAVHDVVGVNVVVDWHGAFDADWNRHVNARGTEVSLGIRHIVLFCK
jgi:hypothetical protein